jgi:hypothetical protein
VSELTKKLETEIEFLNKSYGTSTLEQWKSETIKIAEQVWTILNTDAVSFDDDHLISLIAYSIIFWDNERKYQAIAKMWNRILEAVNTNDLVTQSRLGSIINVVLVNLDKKRVGSILTGIDQFDRNKNYGMQLVDLIRNFITK